MCHSIYKTHVSMAIAVVRLFAAGGKLALESKNLAELLMFSFGAPLNGELSGGKDIESKAIEEQTINTNKQGIQTK